MSERRELTIAYLDYNGMPVVNYANRRLNTAGVAIEAGTADDPPYGDGDGHAVEHVVCGSSDTNPSDEVALQMEEQFGGTDGDDIKVETQFTFTLYSNLDMPDRRECERAFMLHATLVGDAEVEAHNNHRSGQTFSLDSVLCERTAVRNEGAWRTAEPYIRVSDGLHYRLYTKNPVKRSGMGDVDHLRKMEPGRLKSWAAKHYVPRKTLLVGVGPTQKEMLVWAQKAKLDGIKPYKGTDNVYDGSDSQPALDGIQEIAMEQPGVIQLPNGKWLMVPSHIGLAWPTETFLSADGPALQVLARILKARVEIQLRDQNRRFDGGVYHPSSTWWSTKYHGLLELWYATVGEREYQDFAEAQVLDIIRHLKEDASEWMERQTRAITRNLASTVDQDWKWYPDRILERIVQHWTNGDRSFDGLYSLRDRFMAVRPEDVRRVAHTYLTTDRYVRASVRSKFIPEELYDQAPEELRPYLQHFRRPVP